ncbi:hypothetical protein ABBQ38_005230 [Trebouxia sp. C0009 RCD-2024]
MPFGQLVIGPAGSGKTTYCNGMQQYLTLLGRKAVVVNLDPANDALPYECAVDIGELVSLHEVQEKLNLGPNGGLVYCIEYLDSNLDWLQEKLELIQKNEATYVLFDLPGQVELFTLHESLRHIVDTVTNTWHYRLAAVHLVDAHLCSDPAKYISALLLSLSAMLHLELPHVNLLSKIDLIEQYGKLQFNLDFYTEVQDLSYLVQAMGNDPFSQRYRKLSQGLCQVVEDFGLLHFTPLAIEEKGSVQHVLSLIDKANGHVFAGLASGKNPYPPEFVYGAGLTAADTTDMINDYEEKYVNRHIEERYPSA